MKDWRIRPGIMCNKQVMILAHRCKGEQYVWARPTSDYDEPFHWCSVDKDGWICGLCQERPPESMAEAADLCQCYALHIYDISGRMLEESER